MDPNVHWLIAEHTHSPIYDSAASLAIVSIEHMLTTLALADTLKTNTGTKREPGSIFGQFLYKYLKYCGGQRHIYLFYYKLWLPKRKEPLFDGAN